MRYVFYDVESTGLTRSDEVIQFAAVITNEKLIPVSTENFYCYTQVPISKKAHELVGISAHDLMKLSSGKTFEDNFLELPFVKDDKDVTWVSYSTNGFDERLINQTLVNNGLPKYNFGKKIQYFNNETEGKYVFDACNSLKIRVFNGKIQRLGQVAESINFPKEKIANLFAMVAPDYQGKFHDALYDAYILWLSVYVNRVRLGFELH